MKTEIILALLNNKLPGNDILQQAIIQQITLLDDNARRNLYVNIRLFKLQNPRRLFWLSFFSFSFFGISRFLAGHTIFASLQVLLWIVLLSPAAYIIYYSIFPSYLAEIFTFVLLLFISLIALLILFHLWLIELTDIADFVRYANYEKLLLILPHAASLAILHRLNDKNPSAPAK